MQLPFFRPRFTPDEAIQHLEQAWEYYSIEADSPKKRHRTDLATRAPKVPGDR